MPSAAEAAACSHPGLSLAHRDGAGGPGELDVLDLAEQLLAGRDGSPGSLPPGKTPCEAGMCSQAPLVPFAPAPSPAPRDGEWGLLFEAVALTCHLVLPLPGASAPLHPILSSGDVFHPPRPTFPPFTA